MDHRISDLAAFLGAGSAQPERADRRGIPEAQVERLREVQQRYAQVNDFVPGDLVTPRPDAGMINPGDVLIVLEVVPKVWPQFNVAPYGGDKRFDTRVAFVSRDGRIMTCWAESFELQPWNEASTSSASGIPRPAAPAETGFGAAA